VLEPQYILRSAFSAICQQLQPTTAENERRSKAVKGVHDVVVEAAKGRLWKLMGVQPVGSFKRKTSLRGS
jgi:tRNA nucleotidyltransferase (CCA-adding enzyme)